MGCFNLTRAILVRLLFSCHGLIAIWRLVLVSKDDRYWYLTTALGGLFVETIVTLCKKKGREWKWFCPSVFFYLLSVVPAIWFLELDQLHKRMALQEQLNNNTEQKVNESSEDHRVANLTIMGIIRLEFLSSDQWIKTIEQILLLFLIMGRWILPKGKLTHDQLSQLLLVYIGTAADIVEFFDAFKEDKVRHNETLCVIILSIWSWSLLQFTMVLTATRARKDQSGLLTRAAVDPAHSCCTPDVYGIVISIFMQDAPFLVLRLLLIFRHSVVSYTNMFFTSKNTLVILLLIYRLVVVQCAIRKEVQKQKRENKIIQESWSRQGLLHSYSDNSCGGRSPNGYRYYAPNNLANSYTYDELRIMPNKKNKLPRDRSRPNSGRNTPTIPRASPRPKFRPRLDNNVAHAPSDGSSGPTPYSTPMGDRHDVFLTPAASPEQELRGHKMWDPVVERCPKSLLLAEAQTLRASRPNTLLSPNSHDQPAVHKPIRASKSCETLSPTKGKNSKKTK